ncbi:protein kinase C beta type-like [Salvelinus alpinus]|uniref:protein kinase C beta type-like n=1 Tax=Salvelinus fontinalis TaxID=8038 RepID=UPI002484D7BC|nr:protein kinase C beta type-like [Salvelinus fontinalis]
MGLGNLLWEDEQKKSNKDTCNFDKEFTKMPVDLTPTDKLFIMNLDQDEFLGFSYTNPEYPSDEVTGEEEEEDGQS